MGSQYIVLSARDVAHVAVEFLLCLHVSKLFLTIRQFLRIVYPGLFILVSGSLLRRRSQLLSRSL